MEQAGGSVALGGGPHAARARGRRPAGGPSRPGPTQVEIVVPVYNEAHQLAERIGTLRAFLNESLPFSTLVTIVDNGSTDGTALVAQRLASTLDGVQAMILTRKGRGHALRCAWEASSAEVVAYMDVDLSTSLSALMPLVASVLSGHGDVAVGTRLGRGARVVRGPKRELISRAYSLLVRTSLRSKVSDFQCGFKALAPRAGPRAAPAGGGRGLVLRHRVVGDGRTARPAGDRDPGRVGGRPRLARAPRLDRSRGPQGPVAPLARAGAPRGARAGATPDAPADVATADQLLSFAGVGLLSTLSYLLLFSLGWRAVGPWLANALALAFCTVVNTALHTGAVRRRQAGPDAAPGDPPPSFVTVTAALFGVSLVATTAALALAQAARCHLARRRPGRRHARQRGGVAGAFRPAARLGLPPRAAGDVTDLIDAATRDDLEGGAPDRAAAPPAGRPPRAARPAAAPPLGIRLRPLLRPGGYYVGSRLLVWCAAAVAAVLYPRLTRCARSGPSGTAGGTSSSPSTATRTACTRRARAAAGPSSPPSRPPSVPWPRSPGSACPPRPCWPPSCSG